MILYLEDKLQLISPADLKKFVMTINTPKFGIKNIFQIQPASFLDAVPVGKVFFNEIIGEQYESLEPFRPYLTDLEIRVPEGLVLDYSTYIKCLILKHTKEKLVNYRYFPLWVGETEEEIMVPLNKNFVSHCKGCLNNACKRYETNFTQYILDYERAFISINSELFTT